MFLYFIIVKLKLYLNYKKTPLKMFIFQRCSGENDLIVKQRNSSG